MGPDPSSLELPALVEQAQSRLAVMRLRISEPGPMSPGDRTAAAEQLGVLVATLSNLRRVLHRGQRDTIDPGGDHAHA